MHYGSKVGSRDSMISFNLSAFKSYIDFEELNFYAIALSSDGGTLAIATGTNLLITDDRFTRNETDESSTQKWQEFPNEGFFSTIETVLEFSKQSGRCTALCWLGETDIIAVGFESGDFACFDANGNGVVEQKCDDSAILSFKISNDSLPASGSSMRNSKSSSMEGDEKECEPSLWILHENSIVTTVPLQSLLVGEFDGLIRFQLLNTAGCNDFLILPNVYSPIPNKYLEGLYNETRSESKYYQDQLASHSVLVSGHNASLGLYNVGGPQHFEHFGKFTEYVKTRTVNYVSRTIFNIFGSASNLTNGKTRDSPRLAEHVLDLTNGPKISVTSVLDFSDEKRRILRLCLDPTGRFVAASDSLGRVMVFDARMYAMILVFKGLREARLAWTQKIRNSYSERVQTDLQLALGIYAPRLGLVIFNSVPSGIPLRSVPVGLHCHFVTLYPPRAGELADPPLAQCYVWRQVEKCAALELIKINPWELSPSLAVPGDSRDQERKSSADIGSELLADLNLEVEMGMKETEKDEYEAENSHESAGAVRPVGKDSDIGERAERILGQITASGSGDALLAFRSLCGMVHEPTKALKVLRSVQHIELMKSGMSNKAAVLPSSVHECVNEMLARVSRLADTEFPGEEEGFSSSMRHESVARKALLPVYEALRNCASQSLKSLRDEQRLSSSVSHGEALLNPFSDLSVRLAGASKGDDIREEAVAYCTRALRLAAAARIAKQVSVPGPGHSQQVGGTHRGRSTSKALGSGADAGGSSPASVSSSIDGYLLSPTVGNTSQSQPMQLRTAVLRSPKEPSPLLAGSPSTGGSRPNGSFHQQYSSHYGSFDSTSSAPASVGTAPSVSTSPTKSGTGVPIEEVEASTALELSFSKFRIMFECRCKFQSNQYEICLLPEVLHSCANSRAELPLALIVQDTALLCGDAQEDERRGRYFTLERTDLRKFQALILMPLLHSPADHLGPMSVEVMMQLHRACGLDNVHGAVFLLGSATSLITSDQNGFKGVERLLFSLIPLDPNANVCPQTDAPFLRPWLRAIISDIFQVYSDLKNDMDTKGQGWGSLLLLSDPEEGVEDLDSVQEGDYKSDELHNDWLPEWPFPRLNSTQDQALPQDDTSANNCRAYSRNRRENNIVRQHMLIFMSRNLHSTKVGRERHPSSEDMFSFDELLKCVLDIGILNYLTASLEPTSSMTMCSLLLDVLKRLGGGTPSMQDAASGAVSLEVPRDMPVALSYQHCMTVFRRLRVTLLLSARCGRPVSIDAMNAASNESIYHLLAADTLRFALTGSAATAHESRCRNTTEKKLSANQGDGPLLAYGIAADARWRELLGLIEADEVSELEAARHALGFEYERLQATGITSGNSISGRKRRPLLLQFPFHNQPTVLGMHRALVLASRCFVVNSSSHDTQEPASSRKSSEETVFEAMRISPHFLMLATSQLEGLPPTPRTAVALQVLLAPLPRVAIIYLLLRLAAMEDYPETAIVSGSHDVPDLFGTTMEGMTRHLTNLFSQAVAQPASAHEFVQGMLELLLAAETTLSASPSMDASQLNIALEHPSRLYLAPTASVCSDISGGGRGGPWPPLEDSLISSSLTELLSYQAYGGTQRGRFARLFSELTLVMFLRFACRLRGAKPSELFESSLLKRMYSKLERLSSQPPLEALSNLMDSTGINSDQERESLNERRFDFLRECFSRVSPDHEMSLHFIYRLGLLWGRRESNLMIMHLPVLLGRGLDEQAGDLLGKLQYSDQALNTAIEGLRERAGKALMRLRDFALPAYKQVASLGVDDDVLRWALRAATRDTGSEGTAKNLTDHLSTSHALLSCDLESSNILALLISQKLTQKSASQQASESWRRLSGKSNALLILYRALTKIK